VVGWVIEATPDEVEAAVAGAAASGWRDVPAGERAAVLLRAADAMEAAMPELLGLIIREAGKSLANAVAEVREAVDFLRYYAVQVRDGFDNATHVPLGAVVCISPWNFPLAIFTGQVAAALAAGNGVLAKPAEETPLIAAQAVAILHGAGVPVDALHLLPGEGEVGAGLVADGRVRAVLFTGSTEVARLIQRELARRLNPDGSPVPMIAETGGQNALVVDSSALAEQVVADVLVSAFDSAGQRCSALRVLCLQDDVADRTLTMLKGALDELVVGNPDRLATDIGPVISAEARESILGHIAAMRAAGRKVHQAGLPAGCAHGIFVPPTIIELESIAELEREVFGPVLHVVRFRRHEMEAMIDAVNATGYGLTFGIHTRIDETVARATARTGAGNVYVNRNLVGAVVGVQPFGGHGLSGTGPKAGGPLYLMRLLARRPAPELVTRAVLPGPVGEENVYRTVPRGTVLCVAETAAERARQRAAAEAGGNRVVVNEGDGADAVLFAGSRDALIGLAQRLCERPGPLVQIHVPGADDRYPAEWLVLEQSISTNTTAAGGNASLMTIS
jgi:RHH-type proline utilization regulon transcriptional repressor/proline dehydrogenase/delta 1-pyrroline-5-carboxylate dehydrogenase